MWLATDHFLAEDIRQSMSENAFLYRLWATINVFIELSTCINSWVQWYIRWQIKLFLALEQTHKLLSYFFIRVSYLYDKL